MQSGIAGYISVDACQVVCVRNKYDDGGGMSFVRTAVHIAGVQLPSRGWAKPCWRGQGTEGRDLLIPQDGVLVVQLQVLY